jgi:hypothetical protein
VIEAYQGHDEDCDFVVKEKDEKDEKVPLAPFTCNP